MGCGSGFGVKKIAQYQKTIYSMEAVGISVFNTLKNNNITYEIKPTYTSKLKFVCLICSEKKCIFNEKKTQKDLLIYM